MSEKTIRGVIELINTYSITTIYILYNKCTVENIISAHFIQEYTKVDVSK